MYRHLDGYEDLGLNSEQFWIITGLEGRVDREISNFTWSGWWKYCPDTGLIKFEVFCESSSATRPHDFLIPLDRVLTEPDQVFEEIKFRVIFQ
jgi:hypothetical protein